MSTPQEKPLLPNGATEASSILKITHAVYALQAVGLFLQITFLVGVIVNYVKLEEAAPDPLLASHFRWQIRTFWFGLLWGVVGAIFLLVLIGYVIWVAAWIWLLYRIIKGWLYLVDRKPMYVKLA